VVVSATAIFTFPGLSQFNSVHILQSLLLLLIFPFN